MKKFFIAAVMMVAAMSVNAKGTSDIFTQSVDRLCERYNLAGLMSKADYYFHQIKKTPDVKEMESMIKFYQHAGFNTSRAVIMGLQEFNEKHPDVFHD